MSTPLRRFEWERVVMRVRMPLTTKMVALALAHYASQDGGRIHPGEKQLARDIGRDERTVRRHVTRLRDQYRLIHRVSHGGGPNRLADVYQLVSPDQPLEFDPAVAADEPDETAVDNVVELRPGRSRNDRTPDTGEQNSGHSCVLPPPIEHPRTYSPAVLLLAEEDLSLQQPAREQRERSPPRRTGSRAADVHTTRRVIQS